MGWARSDWFLPDKGVRAGPVAGSFLYRKASEGTCGIPCHMTRGLVRGSGTQCRIQCATRDYARDQASRDASVASSGIYGTEYEASCELPCLARATCGVLSVMRGMLRVPRARTLSCADTPGSFAGARPRRCVQLPCGRQRGGRQPARGHDETLLSRYRGRWHRS